MKALVIGGGGFVGPYLVRHDVGRMVKEIEGACAIKL